ncbi:hypothetical protein ACX16A_23155 [Bacillus cereus]
MKKTLAISAITLALTGMGASSSFANSKNVSVTPEKISQRKAVKVANKSKKNEETPLNQNIELKNGVGTSRTFEHKKNANARISIKNNSTGGIHWYLKDSKGKVIMDDRMAKGGFYKSEFYLSKGNYKIRVVSDNNGTGTVHVGARSLE